jgi:thiol-disulfide isomerase/thioredoxin
MSPALLLIAALGAAPQAELLDFTAKWCGPCQQMSPIVARLQREGYPIRQVDVDRYPDVSKHYGINGIPAFVLVVNGREVGRQVGATSEASLRQLLRKIPASAPSEPEARPDEKKPLFQWPFKKEKAQPPEPPQFEDSEIRRGQTPEEPAPPVASTAPQAAQDPIQTAVRIKVKDDKGGTDLGSGTIIGSKEGQALILTCWHIFRDFGPSAKVEVDLFPNGPAGKPQTIPGRMLACDEKADVALVGITGCTLMPVSPVASVDQFPKEGSHVFSIGCGHGSAPSKLQHRVTRINPYEGPDTTECEGMPVVGRSGGGLFDTAGRVIGVCFAAEKQNQTGVYVGTGEIHKLLHRAGYARLIPEAMGTQLAGPAGGVPPEESRPTPEAGGTEESNPFAPGGGVAVAETETPPQEPRPDLTPTGTNTADALAAVEEGAEVICTIRPLKPGRPTEVVVINRASRRFLRYLKGEIDSQPVQTSMRIPPERASRDGLVTADLVTAVVGAKAPHVAPGVALLARIFDNHGRP